LRVGERAELDTGGREGDGEGLAGSDRVQVLGGL
jgi:hypothetical protein